VAAAALALCCATLGGKKGRVWAPKRGLRRSGAGSTVCVPLFCASLLQQLGGAAPRRCCLPSLEAPCAAGARPRLAACSWPVRAVSLEPHVEHSRAATPCAGVAVIRGTPPVPARHDTTRHGTRSQCCVTPSLRYDKRGGRSVCALPLTCSEQVPSRERGSHSSPGRCQGVSACSDEPSVPLRPTASLSVACVLKQLSSAGISRYTAMVARRRSAVVLAAVLCCVAALSTGVAGSHASGVALASRGITPRRVLLDEASKAAREAAVEVCGGPLERGAVRRSCESGRPWPQQGLAPAPLARVCGHRWAALYEAWRAASRVSPCLSVSPTGPVRAVGRGGGARRAGD
jgi:hypothetical protein